MKIPRNFSLIVKCAVNFFSSRLVVSLCPPLSSFPFPIHPTTLFSGFCGNFRLSLSFCRLYNWFSFIVTNTRVERNLIKTISRTCQARNFCVLVFVVVLFLWPAAARVATSSSVWKMKLLNGNGNGNGGGW